MKKLELFRYALLTVFFLGGLVIRWQFDRHFQPNWYGDQIDVIRNARAVASGTYLSTFYPYWPPMSILIQGVVFKLFGIKALRDVFYLQAILSGVTILFAEVAARRLFGKIAGLIAAGVFALYVPFVYYTALILSETTFFFFTIAAIAMLARYLDTEKRRDLIFAGILFGLSALARPVSLPLPVLAFFLLWIRKNGLDALKQTLMLLVVVGLTIAPWTIRNWIVVGEPVLIDLNGGLNLYLAHNEKATGQYVQLPITDPAIKWQGTPEGEKLAKQAALAYIKTHPRQTFDQFQKVNGLFWNENDFDVEHYGKDLYSMLHRWHLPQLDFLTLRWLALLGVFAFFYRPSSAVYLGLFVLVYNVVIDLLYFAPRYRMVVEPFLILLLAGGVQALVQGGIFWLRPRKLRAERERV